MRCVALRELRCVALRELRALRALPALRELRCVAKSQQDTTSGKLSSSSSVLFPNASSLIIKIFHFSSLLLLSPSLSSSPPSLSFTSCLSHNYSTDNE